MSGCNEIFYWLLFLIAANGGLLGALVVQNKRARTLRGQLEQTIETAVREFARWRELADASEAARLIKDLKGGPGARADGCAPGS